MLTRRQFAASAPWIASSPLGLSACASDPDPAAAGGAAYRALAAEIRLPRALDAQADSALSPGLIHELVRCATLAPSSHNTQCWNFAPEAQGITILPDLSRRCPAVDPDDHHVFVTLGCAAENLAQAALAHGLHAEPQFDATRGATHLALSPTKPHASALFQAIATRQCTRSDYDGQPISSEELRLLEAAGSANGVRLRLLTDRPTVERLLAFIVDGNTAQIADPAFVKELKQWIRFNGAEAIRHRDGLFSVASGSPDLPTWLGDLAFGWLFTAKGENDKIARRVRSSAGLAVFLGEAANPSHWVAVGRAYERFALQATALGIRNAFLNQPVEVAAVRSPFAAALGLAGQRPDLVVRFGRGPTMPLSLRRPVAAVMA